MYLLESHWWMLLRVLPGADRTWCGLRWSHASSCGRWYHGNPSSLCTSTLSTSDRERVVEKTQKENDVYHMCQTQGLWAKCGPTSHIAWPAGAYKVYAFSARILTINYNNNAFHDDERWTTVMSLALFLCHIYNRILHEELLYCLEKQLLQSPHCKKLTSAGTLNFSTTPSSKKIRMPVLMRSCSVTGKSLKENLYISSPFTLFAGGQVVRCIKCQTQRHN